MFMKKALLLLGILIALNSCADKPYFELHPGIFINIYLDKLSNSSQRMRV